MTGHKCPGGCGASVPSHQLACRVDWYRLPEALRMEVNRAYRTVSDGGRRHRVAVAEALQWYRANPRPGVIGS